MKPASGKVPPRESCHGIPTRRPIGIQGRRGEVILSTKAGLPFGAAPSDLGSTVVSGARNEAQLRENLGVAGWTLTPAQLAKLDAASDVTPAYPYWPYRHQEGFAMRNPPAPVSDPEGLIPSSPPVIPLV
jgi:hypothetical protein